MQKRALSICLQSELNNALREMLSRHHTGLEICTSFAEAKAVRPQKPYCLIICDASTISEQQTIQSLERMRSCTYAPVLLLTLPEPKLDFVKAGADFCLPISAAPETIVSTAFSLLRRYTIYNHYDRLAPGSMAIYRGELAFDHLRHHVTLSGEELHLTPKEYKLLHYFLRNPGIVISADQICDSVWGIEYDDNRDVTTVIAELRRKLKDTRENPVFIRTVHGFGYQFLPQE